MRLSGSIPKPVSKALQNRLTVLSLRMFGSWAKSLQEAVASMVHPGLFFATGGSVVAAYTVVPAISDSAQAIRDYSLSDSSSSMTVNQNSSGSSTMYVASMNGFDLATGLGATVFLIRSSCGSSCTLTGNAFTLVAGNTYTVIVVTSRNNQFLFSLVR